MVYLREPELSYVRYQWLNEHGTLTATLPPRFNSPDYWQQAYRHMWLTRLFDQRAVALQRTGQLGTYASCLGQEAISTAIGLQMAADDVLVPYYRDQAAQLLRGVHMESILRFWGGDEWGCHDGPSQDLPPCIPIATQISHAAGVATAIKLRQEKKAVVCTCGDGASSRGDFYEALNVAGVWHLPLVLVINNNQWAISVPLSQQTACHSLAQKAVAAGIPSIQVDGNDFFAMAIVLEAALQRAHEGKGPTLIEAVTYRLCDHTTADDMNRYANREQREQAGLLEPLLRFRQFLSQHQQWQDTDQQQMEQALQNDIAAAVKRYLALTNAPASDMFDYLYAELPDDLQQQKTDWLGG